MNQSFMFVLNLIDVDGETPVEVIANHYLRQAEAAEIESIKEMLARLLPQQALMILPNEHLSHETPPSGPVHMADIHMKCFSQKTGDIG
jgi:hypothetical protein